MVLQIERGMKIQVPTTLSALGRELGIGVTAIRTLVQILEPFGYVSPEFDLGGCIQIIKSNRDSIVVFSSIPPLMLQVPIPLQIVFQGKGISDFREGHLAPKEGTPQAKVTESGR